MVNQLLESLILTLLSICVEECSNTVETKLAVERKRRKSDLVVMWQSVWHVTSLIGQELWISLLRMWELIQMWFSSSDRFQVQTWLEKYLPYVPDDFSDSWRDGRLLAILLNKLQPGCFPDAHQLDPDYKLRNVYKVCDVLDTYFGIKPNVSAEEIVTCTDGSDSKLFAVFLKLKQLDETQPENEIIIPELEVKEHDDQSDSIPSCIAKGTGLAVGFVGKLTNFIIFCAFMSDLDIVIQIRGPTTICSERITKRSPKKKRPVSPLEYSRPITRSVSYNERYERNSQEDDNCDTVIIPLEYEIIGNQVSFSYKPQEKGKHKLTILWHGQHVSDSPYTVSIEDPTEITGMNKEKHLKSALKSANQCEKSDKRKISVKFQESQVKQSEQKKHSVKVRSKRVLGYIIKINGKDVPVNAENMESLATELLKMDYDFETSPSFHRRNSWGFAGEAERKKSVIRQFCIDINELQSRVSQRRSNSLSLSPVSKKLLQKSDSFDSLATKLNIVDEDVLECSDKDHRNENETDFAFIEEDLNLAFQDTRMKCEEKSDAQYQTNSCRETVQPRFSNERSESNSDANFLENCNEVMDSDQISSLSTEIPLKEKVDNLKEDHPIIIASNISALDSSCSTEQSTAETETLKKDVSDIEPVLSRVACKSLDSHPPKYVPLSDDTVKILPKLKKIPYARKCIRMQTRKRSNVIRIPQKVRKEILHKKLLKNEIIIMPNTTSFKKQFEGKKCMQNACQETPSSNFRHGHETEDFSVREKLDETPKNIEQKHDLVYLTNENSNASPPHPVSCVDDSKSNNLNPNLQISISKNIEKEIMKDLHCSFVNITDHQETVENAPETSKEAQIQPETKRLNLNHTSKTTPMSSVQVGTNDKDTAAEICKPLRTHTLITFKQFNFKQFNPLSDAEYSTGPVKSQIEQWENSLSSEKQNIHLRKASTSETEQGNVKEKLAFWEKTYKAEQNSSKQSTPQNNRKMNGTVGMEQRRDSSESNSDAKMDDDDLSNLHGTGAISSSEGTIIMKEQKETVNLINKEINTVAKKEADDKLSPDLQLNSCKTNQRSFSDPGVLESVNDITNYFSSSSCLESSSKEQLSSSNDDNIKESYLEENESDASGIDSFYQISEGEYIDDEIQERASEYWGDLGILKGIKVAGTAAEDYSFWQGQIFPNRYQHSKSFPEECKVFGIAVYYGYVAEKNRFQIFTGDAGFGNLSVSMQGFGQHDVSLVSVTYVRNDIYEVTYQVMTAGYYLISIRWMDKAIPGSPFVCRVTY